MEKEGFFSGYCRQTDASRMVCVVSEAENLTDCDCCYPNCSYVSECTVAKQIDSFLQEK